MIGNEELEPPQYVGRNIVVPFVLLAVALSLPPVVGTIGPRVVQRVRKGEVAPVSRRSKVLFVVLFASFVTTLFAWVESEMTVWSNYSDPFFRVSNAKTGVTSYDKALEYVTAGRRWVKWHLELSLAVQIPWPTRTRHTIFTFLFASTVGCAVFRPWRRPEIGYHSSDNRPVSSTAERNDVAGTNQHPTDHAPPGVDPRGHPAG
jgi:hypothetical protein